MHKRGLICSLSALLSICVLLLFIWLACPHVYKLNKITAIEMVTESKFNKSYVSGLVSSEPFVVTTPSLNSSKQLYLYVTLHLRNSEESEAFHKEIGVNVQLDGIDSTGRNESITSGGRLTFKLYCSGRQCKPLQVLHLIDIAYNHYRVNITFDGLESVNTKYGIEDIIFTFRSINT